MQQSKMDQNMVLVSLSGGVDSTTLLGTLLARPYNKAVQAVGFNYGSKHNEYELAAAQQIAQHYNTPFRIIDLRQTMADFASDLLLTGGDIPEGHYTDKSMAATVVPARNLIFASILAGLADSIGANYIALGMHAGDHAIYPDCRPDFVCSLRETVRLATDGRVSVHAPFLHWTKTQIVGTAVALNVPLHLTRSCYKAQAEPCGVCGTCVERAEAFAAAGLEVK